MLGRPQLPGHRLQASQRKAHPVTTAACTDASSGLPRLAIKSSERDLQKVASGALSMHSIYTSSAAWISGTCEGVIHSLQSWWCASGCSHGRRSLRL